MRAVGIDGCPGGWICVWIDSDGTRGWNTIETIEQLSELEAAIALIDIPIGLPDHGKRNCDLDARNLLGKARDRVFLYVRRGLLDFHAYDEMNAWGKANGAGVTKQMFCILPKIREVDEYAQKYGQKILKETHPELIFQRLNGGVAPAKKKSKAGIQTRKSILAANGFNQIDEWLLGIQRSIAKSDDLLDACACAIAASDFLAGKAHRVPSDDNRCSRGITMEMWY